MPLDRDTLRREWEERIDRIRGGANLEESKKKTYIDVLLSISSDKKVIAETLGVSLPAVYSWLRGKKPREKMLQKIMEYDNE